jgi:hypothetical protein
MARFTPQVGAQHYQTWSIAAPIRTHWRQATCAETNCKYHLDGWVSIVPAGSDLEHHARQPGRSFTEERRDGGLIAFTYPPGQRCFWWTDHRVRVERPELHIVRGGDWRGNPRGNRPKVYDKPYQWVDDMHGHLDRLADLRD